MLLSVLIIIVVIYSILAWTLFFMQSRLTFQPSRELPYNPSDIGLEYEEVKLETADGLMLSAWYVPAKNGNTTLLFCHGNGGNMTHRLESINIFNRLGLNCLIFDYRGYGQSQGKPSERGVYMDAQTAYDWLRKEKGLAPEEIIIFGRSLGGTVAAHLASNVKAKGLILESCFSSYVDIARRYYPYMPVKLFSKFSFNAVDYVKKVHYPVLCLHSKGDEIVSYKFGRKVYDAANEPKKFIEIFGSHNSGYIHSGHVYYEGIRDWLESLESCRQGSVAK
ncbi:MAG: alpha/beta fold hydrolase [Sedimentisphaerales bacterium]|nr:alpha/beta fold hydrolase [Sedimentisphaerales bacterium]